KTGDEMPIAGIALYLKSHPEADKPELYFPGSKTLKPSAMESLARAAFFSFAWEHPKFAFETFFIWKPWGIRMALKRLLLTEFENVTPVFAASLAAVLAMIGILAGADVQRARFGNFTRFCLLFGLMLVPCFAIPWITVVAENVMSEQLFATQIATALLV